MIKPPSRTNLYEEVAKQIISIIKSGEWSPGDRISGEVDLAQNFQVSRSCIREALKSLELSGITSSRAGRGTFVREDALRNIEKMELMMLLKDETSMMELIETRLVVEVQLAFIAASRATDEDIQRMEKILGLTDEKMSSDEYTVDLGYEFHKALAESSGNKVLAKFMSSITDDLLAQRSLLVMKHLDAAEIKSEHDEHKRILEFVKNREPLRARQAMLDHLNNAMAILIQSSEKEMTEDEINTMLHEVNA